MTDPRAQVLADEIKKRVKALTEKEKDVASRENSVTERERRVTYREENVARRERIIFGKLNRRET